MVFVVVVRRRRQQQQEEWEYACDLLPVAVCAGRLATILSTLPRSICFR